jgi:hypothetical protein
VAVLATKASEGLSVGFIVSKHTMFWLRSVFRIEFQVIFTKDMRTAVVDLRRGETGCGVFASLAMSTC